MSSEEKIHGSIYYVIPAQVFEDPGLEDSEKMFYGLLSGLAFSNGFCFASDAYLAKRKNVDIRTVKRWLEKLEDRGYIRRDTKKNGMFWDRKIFITHSFVKSNKAYEETSVPPSRGRTRPVESGAHAPIVSEALESEDPPPPSSKEEPNSATPEEEEEISKRLSERPRDLPKIKCKSAWRNKVLEELRANSKEMSATLLEIKKHHNQAKSFEMNRNSDGELICSYEEYVEFSCGNSVRRVYYNSPHQEWVKKTGWK